MYFDSYSGQKFFFTVNLWCSLTHKFFIACVDMCTYHDDFLGKILCMDLCNPTEYLKEFSTCGPLNSVQFICIIVSHSEFKYSQKF